MIDVFTWATPNGHKVHVMLEECGLKYTVHGIDIRAGDQFKPEFLSISPNNRIPAIIDSDGPEGKGKPISLFESGAILIYLAGKTGKFLPKSDRHKYEALEWVMWQMGGFGPMLGQAHHFMNYAPEKLEYAINRYANETKRLYGVLDKRLADRDYVAGKGRGEYSIADMAIWPWSRSHKNHQIDFADFPNVGRWFAAIEARPAVQRGVKVLSAERERQGTAHSKEAWEKLFGAEQYKRR